MVAGCASLKVFCTYLSTSDVFPTRPASPQVKVKVNPVESNKGRGPQADAEFKSIIMDTTFYFEWILVI